MTRGQIVPKNNNVSTYKAKTKVKLHNFFKIMRRNTKTNELSFAGQGFNVITDQWFTRYQQGDQFASIAYGSGVGTPTESDTALFTRIDSNTAINETWDETNFYSDNFLSVQKQYTIPAGVNTGVAFRELGIAYDNTAGHLVTHANIEDMNGNPIAIVKGVDDDLILFATIFVHFASNNQYEGGNVKFIPRRLNGAIDWIAGLGDLFTAQPTFDKTIAYAGTAPASTGNNFDIATTEWNGFVGELSADNTVVWNTGNKELTITSPRTGSADLNPTVGDGSCISALAYSVDNGTLTELVIDLPMNGTGGTGGGESDLGYVPISHLKNAGAIGTGDAIEVDFQTPAPFFNTSGFAIYFDGILQSSSIYTIDNEKPFIDDIGYYFTRIEGSAALLGCTDLLGEDIGTVEIAENKFFSIYGIQTFFRSDDTKITVSTSDDLENWTAITGNGTVAVPAPQQNDRYWKAEVIGNATSGQSCKQFKTTDISDFNNIHFNSAPANGVVITHDAQYLCIPKSANTYFDLETVISLDRFSE